MDSKITLEETRCERCGIHFSLPDDYIQSKRNSGGQIFCPNGHSLWFSESRQAKLDKMKAERDSWEKEAQRLLAECDKLREENIRLRKERSWFHRKAKT